MKLALVVPGLLCAAVAQAKPVTGIGAETAWLTPRRAAEIDPGRAAIHSVSLEYARRLPGRGFLAAHLEGGETAWVHVDGAPADVRVALLGTHGSAVAALDVTPIARGTHDFVVRAPPGPSVWLGLAAQPGRPKTSAQIWVAAAQSPGFRWELWEEAAKAWAAHPGQPPEPPSASAPWLTAALARIADALALARGDAAVPAGVEPLLRAEALLADLPAREPVFPYYRRIDVTRRPLRIETGAPAHFTVDGPGIVRIDAYRIFTGGARHREPLELVLRLHGRPVAVASEEAAPVSEAGGAALSSLRRLLWQAPPGRHTLELVVRGGATRLSIYLHRRAQHAEDLASRGEDVAHLLDRARARAGGGTLGDLIVGESAFLAADDDAARARFAAVARASSARLRAFAQLRLAELAPRDDEAGAAVQQGFDAIATATDPASCDLRAALQAVRIRRALAAGDHEGARRLAPQSPEALAANPALIGPALRDAPGGRAPALALLDAAQRERPIDDVLRRRLAREWWAGSRWTSLPIGAHDGAHLVDVLAPAAEARSCADAAAQGTRGYVPLGPSDVDVMVAGHGDAFLHRFHVVVVRPAVELAPLTLRLDGAATALPLALPVERVALAATPGRHRLGASLGHGRVLAPCAMLAGSGDGVVLERHYALLPGATARARVSVAEPGIDGFVGVEVRAAPEARAVHLVLRSNVGVLGRLEVSGSTIDPKVLGNARVGPPIVTVLRVPAQATTLEIVREGDGAPVYVRVMLRRGLGDSPTVEPRLPLDEPDSADLQHLRAATERVRAATHAAERARARLERGELLARLEALAPARSDLDAALPDLDAAGAEHARALLASLHDPPLVPADGRRAVLLAPAAGLRLAPDASACVAAALRASGTDEQARAAARCPTALGPYVAAKLHEMAGEPAAAAAAYADAWRRDPRPALAREAALRAAEAGDAALARTAYALAATAMREGDPDGRRALKRLQGSSRWRHLGSVDVGATIEAEAPPRVPSLAAALAALSFAAGTFHELRIGRANEIALDLDRPLELLLQAACDANGRLGDEGVRCSLHVDVDGQPKSSVIVVPGHEARLARLIISAGRHRVRAAIDHDSAADAVAFVQALTNRPIAPGAPRTSGGWYVVPTGASHSRRFLAAADAPVRLRMQGPTVLRVDALAAAGHTSALAIETGAGGATERHMAPLCAAADERGLRGAWDCHSTVLVPLVDARTYDVALRPVGAPVALSLAVREDEPSEPRSPDQPPSPAPLAFPDRPLPAGPDESALLSLAPPMPNWQRDMGALQLQELGVIGGAGSVDPRVGDRFAETAVLYRRKLDHLPIWLLGGAFLRLRPTADGSFGPPSAGGELLWFTRIPPIRLRWLGDVRVFTQHVDGAQQVSVALETYLERSFEVAPRFYLLPRAAFVANYQSLAHAPPLPRGAPLTAEPIDPQVWNAFDARHQLGLYGQLLVWWVPFVNMITYAEARVNSSPAIDAVDRVSARAGFDIAFHGTEVVAYYDLTQSFADSARRRDILEHRLAAEIDQNLWLHRNHRLVARVGGFLNPVTLSSTVFFGLFWEVSFGRGLEDYSTPEINLPQQLGRGRGIVGPEHPL